MKVGYKNTEISIDIQTTDSNFGIKESDKWCLVKFKVKNIEDYYEIEKEILTHNEITNTILVIEQFLNELKPKKTIIKYIKNFISITLYKRNKNKLLELKLIEPKNSQSEKKHHIIVFEENEIKELLELLKSELQ